MDLFHQCFILICTNIHSIKCCLALPSPCTCTLWCDIMLVTDLPHTVYAESIDRSSRKVMIKECKSLKYLYFFFYNQFSIRLCLHPWQSPPGSLPASTPPGSTENLFPLSSGARPGGWPPSTGQNPPQGRLRHLQLLPDGSQRNPSTSELHCNPFWISFEVFSLSVSAERP